MAPSLIVSPPEELASEVKSRLKALFVAVIAEALVNCNCASVLIVKVALLPEVFTMLPLRLKLPVVIILEVATTLMSPDKVIAPLELITPALLIPVPEMLMSSAIVRPVAMVSCAPESIVVEPPVVPSPLAWVRLMVPALIVVAPV